MAVHAGGRRTGVDAAGVGGVNASPLSTSTTLGGRSGRQLRGGGIVSGRVVDAASGQPVSQVRVLVTGTTNGTLTGDNGRYTLRGLPTGPTSLDIKRIEAIEAMALHPSEGTLVDNRPQLANQLLGQPSANSSVMPLTTITGSIVPNNGLVAPALPSGSYNSGPSHTNSGPLPSNTITSSASGNPMTREKVQEMLDKLDERLIMGEISEQKHSELYDRLQKKLAELL